MTVLVDVGQLWLEYSQFRLTGVERVENDPSALPAEPGALVLRHIQQSGYARVIATLGTLDEAPGQDWFGHQTHVLEVGSSVGIQTWESQRVAQFAVAPGRYRIICAFRPAAITPELELTSLEERVATSEQLIHFVALDSDQVRVPE
jgi:hypothetical protein